MKHMILLNSTGDVTIGWDESQNSAMRDMIAEKLKSGCTFFVLEKKCFGLFKKKLRIRSVHDIKGNSITIADESLSELFKDGMISAGKTPDTKYEVTHNSNDIDEILSNNTLVVNKIAAG